MTPCMPTCEPVQCDQEDASGELRSVNSFGKRRRRRSTGDASARDDLLLVQSIQITDKFGFNKRHNTSSSSYFKEPSTVFMSDSVQTNGYCLNLAGIIISTVVFLAVQMSIIVAWVLVWSRKRQHSKLYHDSSSSISVPARTDSLCKLYDSGYPRRF